MKKTLIISPYAPPSGSGSGLMMYNLLKFFLAGQLVILTSEENKVPNLEKYRLPVPYFYYGSKLLSLQANQKHDTWLAGLKRRLKNFPPTKFFAQIILLAAVPRKIFKMGREIIASQNIEVLLGFSDYGPNLLACYLLHKTTKKPLNLHFYDIYVGNKLPVLFRILARWLEPRLFSSADKISVMCEDVREHYKKKYNREIAVIHNSIIFDPLKLPAALIKKDRKFRISFIGSIYWAQTQAIRNLALAVESLDAALEVELYLYTPHSAAYLAAEGIYPSGKVIFTSCPPDEVGRVMAESDLLFVGLSFNTPYPELINTSCPGKLCEYLISGRTILVHAPQKSFLSKYAEKFRFGLVVSENSVEKLSQAIAQACQNPEKIQELAVNAFQTAVANHRAENNAKLLINMLS